jgi:hypothetical protein
VKIDNKITITVPDIFAMKDGRGGEGRLISSVIIASWTFGFLSSDCGIGILKVNEEIRNG